MHSPGLHLGDGVACLASPRRPECCPSAVAQDVPEHATFVGSTVANLTVNVISRVTGTLRERPYVEGSVVQEGAPLFVLDQREFTARVQAQEAEVANAAAQLAKAESDYARLEPLAKSGAASQADLDAKRAAVLSAKAATLGADAGLEHPVLHSTLASDSVDHTDNRCHLNTTDGVYGGGNAMRRGHRSAQPHSESVYGDFGLRQCEPDRQSRSEPEGRGASR